MSLFEASSFITNDVAADTWIPNSKPARFNSATNANKHLVVKNVERKVI